MTALLACCIVSVHAQNANTGAISGTVFDPSGAVVAGAEVIIKNEAQADEHEVTTAPGGDFSALLLDPGNYQVAVRARGFERVVVNGVRVQITEVTRVRLQLTIASAKEKVAVSASAPGLQTENATLGRVIDHETIVDLPLVNRNYIEILGLTAGVNTDIVDATQLGVGSQEIRSNGARSGDNNFMINGVDANSYGSNITEVTPFGGAGIAIPAPDTIQEFKVQNSLYDAQYGRGCRC